MIEKAVFVRHGDYTNDRLTPLGDRQVRELTPLIKSAFGDASPILVLSSPRQRAIQTASILSDGLGLRIPGFQTCEELADELHSLTTKLPKVHEAFVSVVRDAKYVLVSTHLPVARWYPWWYAKQFGVEVQSLTLEKGEAVCLDMNAKTLIKL